MTTFKTPLRVNDAISDAGDVVLSQTTTLTFSDSQDALGGPTTEQTLYNVPRNSQIIDIYIDVVQAFNSGVSDTLSIGVPGSNATFVGSANLATVGRVRASGTAARVDNIYDNIDRGATPIVGTVAYVTNVPTEGIVHITTIYASRVPLRL